MESATEVKNVFVPINCSADENGKQWLVFNYFEDNIDPWKWPRVLMYQGKHYIWMSWNSDNFHVNYKEIDKNNLATIRKK